MSGFQFETKEKLCNYCEILFIRGDPIFVVFVDSLAHEFKIQRIMNTISNCYNNVLMTLNPCKYLYRYLLSDKCHGVHVHSFAIHVYHKFRDNYKIQ